MWMAFHWQNAAKPLIAPSPKIRAVVAVTVRVPWKIPKAVAMRNANRNWTKKRVVREYKPTAFFWIYRKTPYAKTILRKTGTYHVTTVFSLFVF